MNLLLSRADWMSLKVTRLDLEKTLPGIDRIDRSLFNHFVRSSCFGVILRRRRRKFLAQVEGLLSHMARRLCFGMNSLHQESREVIHGADLLCCRGVPFDSDSDLFGCRAIWYCSREGFFLHNTLIIKPLKIQIKILLILCSIYQS